MERGDERKERQSLTWEREAERIKEVQLIR